MRPRRRMRRPFRSRRARRRCIPSLDPYRRRRDRTGRRLRSPSWQRCMRRRPCRTVRRSTHRPRSTRRGTRSEASTRFPEPQWPDTCCLHGSSLRPRNHSPSCTELRTPRSTPSSDRARSSKRRRQVGRCTGRRPLRRARLSRRRTARRTPSCSTRRRCSFRSGTPCSACKLGRATPCKRRSRHSFARRCRYRDRCCSRPRGRVRSAPHSVDTHRTALLRSKRRRRSPHSRNRRASRTPARGDERATCPWSWCRRPSRSGAAPDRRPQSARRAVPGRRWGQACSTHCRPIPTSRWSGRLDCRRRTRRRDGERSRTPWPTTSTALAASPACG